MHELQESAKISIKDWNLEKWRRHRTLAGTLLLTINQERNLIVGLALACDSTQPVQYHTRAAVKMETGFINITRKWTIKFLFSPRKWVFIAPVEGCSLSLQQSDPSSSAKNVDHY